MIEIRISPTLEFNHNITSYMYNKIAKQLFERHNKMCVSEVKNTPLILKHL